MAVLPHRQDLVGRWKIDKPSLERMKVVEEYYHLSKLDPNDHLLILRSDGTCFFQTYREYQSDVFYTSSECRWNLKMDETIAGSGLQRAVLAIDLSASSNSQVSTRFWIVREKNELVLWNYIGDPDEVNYVDFRKVE